jgi:NAD+ synthase (glutamine-hydrolysing)
MKILIAQLNPTIGDILGNTRKVLEAMRWGKEHGIECICFPEMTLCGYAPDDMVLHSTFIEDMEKHLDIIVRESKGITALVGLVRKNSMREEKGLLNSAAVVSDGKLLGFHDKWLLPTYDVFNERRYFARGKTIQVWNIHGKRIGIVICEDMWQNAGEEISGTSYPWDPVKELKVYKPDILFNLTASPFQSRKADIRVKVCTAAAKTLHCPVVYACQVGANGSVIFDGYSLFVDEEGVLRNVAKGFQEDYMVIDTEKKSNSIPFEHDPMYDTFAALRLGVKDYFQKSGQTKAVIGLSGGIDSALVAVIVTEALGKENVTGVYMPTRYSSEESEEDARELAHNLGIAFKVVEIDALFEQYLQLLGPHFDALEEDITEENIQARIRGTILMAFSNKFKSLLLCTGNKSELALGYCTLYGDMCGGIAVIGDILKTEAYQLAHWINREKEIIPQRTIEKPPSAELRHNQKDSDTLPPYDIVDKIIRGYVEEYQNLNEIAKNNHIDIETVRYVVGRIYKAEHKRRQAPPSLRISKKSFAVGRKKPLHFSGSLTEMIY